MSPRLTGSADKDHSAYYRVEYNVLTSLEYVRLNAAGLAIGSDSKRARRCGAE